MINSLSWQEAISLVGQARQAWVLATVLGTRGSSPRNAGTKMVITKTEYYDTLGGGQFEYQVIAKAREMLADQSASNSQVIINFPLSSKAKQCCGGSVAIMLESFTRTTKQLNLFGAGHVAHALIPIVSQMELDINWIDNRQDLFPEAQSLNSKVSIVHSRDPDQYCRKLMPNSFALVMTHDHSLDYKIISTLLDRDDCDFIGLIGSKTKSLRFRQRLKSDAFEQKKIDAVHCPVGLSSIPGKTPIEIAVSIAAQLLQILNADCKSQPKTGLGWKELSGALNNHKQDNKEMLVKL